MMRIVFNCLKVITVAIIVAFGIGCVLIDNSVKEPTHFDIRKMRTFYTNDSTEKVYDHPQNYNTTGKYLVLDFRDSIYYFTPKSAGINMSGNNLYALTYSDHKPTEEIEKIILIAEYYNDDYQLGDTINHITNVDSILQTVNYQAQEMIFISFKEPHKNGRSRDLKIQYFQKNGEVYEDRAFGNP